MSAGPGGTASGEDRPRNFSPWAAWMLALDAMEDPEPVPSEPGAVRAWRDRAAATLASLLGPAPSPTVPLASETSERVPCDGYRRERLVFDVEPAMSVPAYLLVPDARRGPGPAVLALHGHGPGKDEVCGLDAREVRAAVADHRGDYAHQLARRGYLVLAPDLRGFGERADWLPEDRYFCDTNLVHAYAAGANPLAANVTDARRALDLLAAHPFADPDRLAVVGLSYGATVALFAAAVDERVRATVLSGYFSSLRAAHRVPWNLCGSQVLPGMLGRLEHVHVGACIAPRPLLVESGSDDFLFPVDAARAAMTALARVYDALGAPAGALVHDCFDGGHRWNGVRAYPFLSAALAPGGDPSSTPPSRRGRATP